MTVTNIVGVQFRRAGKIYDFSFENLDLCVGDHVIVDSDKGASLAQVVKLKFQLDDARQDRKLKPILRKATHKEVDNPSGKYDPKEVCEFTEKHVGKHKLDMKILKAEVQFGGSKILIYFSAPGRVDFRDLVKDLATGLKARVELKQVGARDETKLLGGVGICGREFCCSSFLREFVPVSIKMAKNQNLALNPTKVSGGCGRLLCCLTYENDVYSELRKVLPPRGAKVLILNTEERGTVIKSDLLNQTVLVETEAGQQQLTKVEQIKILDKSSAKQAEDDPDHMTWGEDLDLEALSQVMEGAPGSKKPRSSPKPQGRKPAERPQQNKKPRSSFGQKKQKNSPP